MLLWADMVHAQSLSRGPYLQNGNTSAVSVRWRTSSGTGSVVRYGTSAGSLNQSVTNATAKTEHELRITGLSANTKYFYSVGNGTTTLASGNDYFFVTSPTSAKPTRVWVIGDPGTASPSQEAVRDAYYTFTGTRGTDLWLMLGDNAYGDGTDAQYQDAVFDIYQNVLRNSIVWPTLGNHDGHTASSSSQTGPYYNIFTLPRNADAGGVASGTEAYYSFNYGNVHFVCLNSYDVSRSPTGAMLTWLQNDLAANTKDWLVAYFHHPPYSKGSHNSDTETELEDMREFAVPILESHGVDLVLSGHSHSYERSKLLDGHYADSNTLTSGMIVDNGSGREDGTGAYTKSSVGPVPNEGAVYAVPGASGQTSGGSLNHPAMFISMNVLGSMILDFDGDRLDARYLDSTGATRDYFTMQKGGSGNALPNVAITSPASGANFTAPANITINATASDSDGSVTRVDFYAGSSPIGSDTTSPYSITWSNVSAGSYTLTAVATDDDGATRTSAGVPITVGVTSVSFQNGTGGYSGMDDATLKGESGATTTNFGSALELLADGSPDYSAAMRWNLTSIPVGKTVTAVTLTVQVFDSSSSAYELYALKRPWVENQITWQRASTATAWQTVGANGANDRETTVLGAFTPSSGTRVITLNAAGIAKVQAWVNTPSTNHGFIVLDYGVSNGADWRSSEYGTVAQRPKITITYQ